MAVTVPDQFLGLPPAPLADAEVVVLPLPFERTVSYGSGTWRAPRAILDASCQLELFDEEVAFDFERLALLTLPPVLADDGDGGEEGVGCYLEDVAAAVRAVAPRFVLGLGGEHTVTLGLVRGLAVPPETLTVVQVDAHADLLDRLYGRRLAHGTVMRRVRELGCRLIQIGIRSASRSEFELIAGDGRIETYYAHDLGRRWEALLEELRTLAGPVYLTLDVDGLDPAVVPSTGTPQPDGLSWRQVMQVLDAVTAAPRARLVGADVVELVASPHPPGCDLVVAKLAAKVIAFHCRRRAEEGA